MKDVLKKAWHFLWHEDSPQAWIAQIIVAFIIIRYVFYPGIGLIFGTPLPVVAVISGSMEHHGEVMCGVDAQGTWWETCGSWYEERGITQEHFEAFRFPNGFNKGDVIALRGVPFEKIEVGDVIVYAANKQYPIIHRVVERNETTLLTKGDNNPEPIEQYVLSNGISASECFVYSGNRTILSPCTPNSYRVDATVPGAIMLLDETAITEDVVIGKAYGRIRWAGYVKILFVDFLDLIGLDALASRI